jgi:hypothetical protein
VSTPPQDPNDQPRYGGSDHGRDGAPGYGSTPGQGGTPGYGSTPGQGGTPGYGSTPGYGAGGSEPARYGGDQPGFGDDRPAYGGDHRGGAAPRNGLGVAALVVGIVALLSVCLGIVPFLGVLTAVIAIAGIVLGVLGRKRAKRGEATNGGAALAGLVLSVIALLLGIAGVVAWSFGAAFLGQNAEECVNLPTQAEQQACLEQSIEDALGG